MSSPLCRVSIKSYYSYVEAHLRLRPGCNQAAEWMDNWCCDRSNSPLWRGGSWSVGHLHDSRYQVLSPLKIRGNRAKLNLPFVPIRVPKISMALCVIVLNKCYPNPGQRSLRANPCTNHNSDALTNWTMESKPTLCKIPKQLPHIRWHLTMSIINQWAQIISKAARLQTPNGSVVLGALFTICNVHNNLHVILSGLDAWHSFPTHPSSQNNNSYCSWLLLCAVSGCFDGGTSACNKDDKNRSLLELYAPWHQSLAKRLKQHRNSAILMERCLSKQSTYVADAAPRQLRHVPTFPYATTTHQTSFLLHNRKQHTTIFECEAPNRCWRVGGFRVTYAVLVCNILCAVPYMLNDNLLHPAQGHNSCKEENKYSRWDGTNSYKEMD